MTDYPLCPLCGHLGRTTSDDVRSFVLTSPHVQERIAELEKDVARYRWLRDTYDPDLRVRGPENSHHDPHYIPFFRECLWGAELDAAIDKAMKDKT